MPDVVVEIVSPTDRWVEVEQKTVSYLAAGVAEVWIANPREGAITLRSQGGIYRLFQSGETFESRQLAGFRAEIDRIFR